MAFSTEILTETLGLHNLFYLFFTSDFFFIEKIDS